jgi:hypothetical protein
MSTGYRWLRSASLAAWVIAALSTAFAQAQVHPPTWGGGAAGAWCGRQGLRRLEWLRIYHGSTLPQGMRDAWASRGSHVHWGLSCVLGKRFVAKGVEPFGLFKGFTLCKRDGGGAGPHHRKRSAPAQRT